MEAIIGILETLKINNTIWIQLVCFALAYLSLSHLIFKPYSKALEKRRESTIGGEEHAERLVQETKTLTSEYESKARQINSEFKTIYNGKRSEALKEYDQKVNEARKVSQKKSLEVQNQIAKEVGAAKENLSGEVPRVSLTMASKLIGKEVSQ